VGIGLKKERQNLMMCTTWNIRRLHEMKNIDTIFKALEKILELEALIETEIKKVNNVKGRKKLKKLCEKAIKNKDEPSLAALREYIFKL